MGSARNRIHFHQNEQQNSNNAVELEDQAGSYLVRNPEFDSYHHRFSAHSFLLEPTIRLEYVPDCTHAPTILAKRKQGYPKQSPFENEYLRPYSPPRSAPGYLVPAPLEAIDYMIDNGFSVVRDGCSQWSHEVCFVPTNSN